MRGDSDVSQLLWTRKLDQRRNDVKGKCLKDSLSKWPPPLIWRYVNNAMNSLETIESGDLSIEVRKYLNRNLQLYFSNWSYYTFRLDVKRNFAVSGKCNVKVIGSKEFSSFFFISVFCFQNFLFLKSLLSCSLSLLNFLVHLWEKIC